MEDELINKLNNFTFEDEVKCIICKKVHKRKDTDLWVYHSSKGAMCRNHVGVMEWYNKLLEEADKKL